MDALDAPMVPLSENFLAQMTEDPNVRVQGLSLGAGVTPGVTGGVRSVPYGISAEGIHRVEVLHKNVFMCLCVFL